MAPELRLARRCKSTKVCHDWASCSSPHSPILALFRLASHVWPVFYKSGPRLGCEPKCDFSQAPTEGRGDSEPKMPARGCNLRHGSAEASPSRISLTLPKPYLGILVLGQDSDKLHFGSHPLAYGRGIFSQPLSDALFLKIAVIRHPTENNLPKLRSLDHIKHLFSFARRQAHSELCNCHCSTEAGRESVTKSVTKSVTNRQARWVNYFLWGVLLETQRDGSVSDRSERCVEAFPVEFFDISGFLDSIQPCSSLSTVTL
uniref:Uncharacterized protein n=1 Tax=Candidatus Kentrum sp. FM TaxID=2126340 RepID=A0A450VZ21_9GAMM|nr:MAG: hypothetical protein BECKFM1743A_GA0114220_100743 [Candidatus Kentron sp. FM]VFJ50313.1 MAG: hypothetical protein BECKFM1743C_GA0114222_100834 [Candidatus Kentron sp. FM]VFK10012.1 MAG: hypothetical protein BECKFM1743B_GA0114221_101254 [Candidatus Kentron sp. FM]